MDEIEIVFKKAVTITLAGKVKGINFTPLMNQPANKQVELIAILLDKISEPYDFFDSWKEKGSKSVDGFYLMLDMFCYLLIKNGSESAELLSKYQNIQRPYIKHVLNIYNNERTNADVVNIFTGLKKIPVKKKKGKPLDIKNSSILVSKPKAVLKSKNYWELGGETTVLTKAVKRAGKNTITITISNSYGPIDKLKAYVVIGEDNSSKSTLELNPCFPWVSISKVEDIVLIDNDYYKSNGGQLSDNPCEEIPWWRTFKMSYDLPEEEHNINIMIIDETEFSETGEPFDVYNSGIITDWVV